MNNRFKQILHRLMEKNGMVTGNELASLLQVSSKTIQNDVKELNELLEQSSCTITSIRGKGYQLVIEDELKFNHFLDQLEDGDKKMIPDDYEDRIKYIMEKLLFHPVYIKIDDLANELFISRSTLQQHLKQVRKILKKYHLSLDHKPYYGIKVMGDEAQIRYCISEYLFNQASNIVDNIVEWLDIFPEDILDTIKECVLVNLRKHNIMISDISLQNLITHIAIACKRIQENNYIEMYHKHFQYIERKKEFLVAKEIGNAIGKRLNVAFTNHELAYLAIHLQGTKMTTSAMEQEDVFSVIEDEIKELVKEMIVRIDEKYNFQLKEDQDLLIAMSLHLKPAINRFKYHMNIRNPILDDIKEKYPLSFDAALIGAEVLQEKMNIQIDENEVGYLALHIEAALERQQNNIKANPRCLIVCASGLGSAQLLLYKLQNQFSNQLNIIGTTEYYNLFRQSFENIDFIISTIPIEEKLPVPVIQVSTILGNTDLKKITKIISRKETTNETYLREKYTYFHKEFLSSEAVIRFLCDELRKDKIVNSSYVRSVLKREEISPTSFGNFIAIPHPIEPQTKETFWSIVTLKKPIIWGDKPVQAVVLLNIRKDNKIDLTPMYNFLIEFLNDTEKVKKFLECKNFKQLLRLMKSI